MNLNRTAIYRGYWCFRTKLGKAIWMEGCYRIVNAIPKYFPFPESRYQLDVNVGSVETTEISQSQSADRIMTAETIEPCDCSTDIRYRQTISPVHTITHEHEYGRANESRPSYQASRGVLERSLSPKPFRRGPRLVHPATKYEISRIGAASIVSLIRHALHGFGHCSENVAASLFWTRRNTLRSPYLSTFRVELP